MQISQDELERLQTAVKDEQFKKLFLDYVNELQDPQNRETYEREISAMEREKGINTRWIHPTPVFVVKTHVLESASRKMFINVCSCPDIEEASARSEGKGQHWSLPHILSAAGHRMDKDKSGKECLVQDIVFHPNTIQKLRKTPVLSRLLAETSIEAVEKQSGLKISREHTLPKLTVKGGPPPACVIREKSSTFVPASRESSMEFIEKLAREQQQDLQEENTIEKLAREQRHDLQEENGKPLVQEEAAAGKALPQEKNTAVKSPSYEIIHQGLINDYSKFTSSREKDYGARPDALLVKIVLPDVKSAALIDLDTSERKLELLVSSKSYDLSIALPFAVKHEEGTAKFDKSKCELSVTLPVVPFKHPLSRPPPSISDIQPSAEPEIQPDIQPSAEPEIQPEIQPDIQPSAEPEIQPEIQPDIKPSAEPEIQPSQSVSPLPVDVSKVALPESVSQSSMDDHAVSGGLESIADSTLAHVEESDGGHVEPENSVDESFGKSAVEDKVEYGKSAVEDKVESGTSAAEDKLESDKSAAEMSDAGEHLVESFEELSVSGQDSSDSGKKVVQLDTSDTSKTDEISESLDQLDLKSSGSRTGIFLLSEIKMHQTTDLVVVSLPFSKIASSEKMFSNPVNSTLAEIIYSGRVLSVEFDQSVSPDAEVIVGPGDIDNVAILKFKKQFLGASFEWVKFSEDVGESRECIKIMFSNPESSKSLLESIALATPSDQNSEIVSATLKDERTLYVQKGRAEDEKEEPIQLSNSLIYRID